MCFKPTSYFVISYSIGSIGTLGGSEHYIIKMLQIIRYQHGTIPGL